MNDKKLRVKAIGLLLPGMLAAPAFASTSRSVQRVARTLSYNHSQMVQGVSTPPSVAKEKNTLAARKSPFSAFKKNNSENGKEAQSAANHEQTGNNPEAWHKKATLDFLQEQNLLNSLETIATTISGEERVEFSRRRRGSCFHGGSCQTTAGIGETTCTSSNGGTYFTQNNCAAGGGDSDAPTNDSGPSVSGTTDSQTTVNFDLNEQGTVYAIAIGDGETAPTSAQVKAGVSYTGATVASANSSATGGDPFSGSFNLTGLASNTAYDVYVVSEDDEGTPNLQASPSSALNITTLISAPNITAVSIPDTAMKVGDSVTATITVDSNTDDFTGGSGGISGNINGFTLGSLAKTNDTTYTASFTVANGGTDVAAGSNITQSVQLTNSAGTAGNTFTTAITGSSDAIDANNPTISTFSPTDGNTTVSADSNFVITFNENIAAGSGNVTIYDSGDNADFTIAIGDGQIDITGAVLTINPSSDLTEQDSYYIQIDAAAIDDSAGNSFAGIADTTTYNFTVPDATAPTNDSSSNVASENGTSITINVDINEAGTVYAIAIPDGATAPSSSEVKAGVNYGAVTVAASNSKAVTAAADTLVLSSLAEGTAYDIYVVAEDDETSPNLQASPEGPVSQTTSDVSPPVVQSITESSADDATSVAFTVTFNEDANNVTTGDFEITNVTGDATGSIDSIATAVADTTYTVTVTPSGEGSFRLDLSASTDIVDDSGNGNGTNGSVATYTSGTAHTVSFTTASTTGAGFSTGGTPTNISPSFTFDSSDETLTITDGSHMTGSTAAAAGETTADTIVIATNQSADFTALASFSGFEALTLNDDASATMTETDHEGFTSGITAGAGTETITLSTSDGDDTITGDADIEAYTLNDVYTFTLGASGQDVTGSDAASQTINIGTFTLSATSDLDGGSGQSDVLQMATGSSIASAGSIAGFETVDVTGSVTMTEAQHDGFSSGVTASGGSDQITISSADGDASVTADADVETYVLGAGMTIIHGAAGQNITGSTSADTISTSFTATGTLDGGSGTDTLSLGNGADVDSATVSNFENLTLADGATVAVNATQLVQFSGTITANGSETINVNNDGDVTTLATTAVEGYVVGDDSTNSRTITLGSGHTSGAITANSSDDAVTFNIGTQSFAGTLTGEGTTNDTVQMGNGSSIVSATLNNIENLTVDSGASVTMTEDQHDAFTGTITATGTNQITISAATDGFTANADIETYVLSVANSVTLGTSGGSLTQNITGSTGSDTLTLGAATYSGILNAGDGTDTLSVVDNTNIVGATLSNFENLTLASDATLLMAAADLADFSGTVTAPGTEQITVSGDGDISTFNSAAVETYVVNDDTSNTRTITLGSNDTGTDISATSTSDTVTFSVPGITYTGTLEGQTTNGDILLLADSANVSGGTLTDIGSLSLASGASVTLSAAQYNALNNATIVAAGTGVGGEEITISGTGDLTINSTTVETYTIEDDSSDSRTITVGSDNSNTFTASSVSDAISLNVGATTFSGSFTANTDVANTLVVDGTADIASATLSGFTNLTLDGATNDLTLTVAQLNAFSGTITGSGTDTLTFTATGSVTGGNLTAIETFSTGSGGSITITIPASDVSTKTLNVTTSASDSFTVTGSASSQTINGSAGGDNLSGGDGADVINGNAGNDTLNGGAGADTLSPGAGTDSMTGSDGNDTFSGSASDLTGDTITDLSEGDTVKVTGVTGLTTSNVRFNGANTLQLDTDATDFSAVEVAITLSNSAGGNLNILAVSDNSGDTDITFESANDVPVFSNLDNNPAFTENGSAVVLDDNVAIADTELDALNTAAGNYSGATLTIARNGGADADDEFAASGLLGALTASGNLTYSSLVYGTVTTNGSGTLVLTFSDASNVPTTAIVASIMRAITYSNGSEAPDASVTLDWTFNDGTANSTGTNQVLVSVTAQNDAPVLNSAASPALTAITEDAGDDDGSGADGDDDDSSNTNNAGTAVATMVTDASITDVDGSAVEAIAVVTVDNTNGVWQYSTDNGTTWNNFSGTTGSSVDLSTAARLLDGTLSGASTHKVRFVPSGNYNGSATITYRAWDKSTGSAGSTADTSTTGGTSAFSTVSDSASVTVSSVNDVPSVDTNTGVTVERGSNLTISSSALSTSDVEDAASNITYTVTAVPTLGALQLSDGNNYSSLSNSSTFTQDDIDNDYLRYVHAGGVNTSDSFSFSVADQNSGSVTGQTFNITVQDTTAPTITAVSIPNSTHKVGDTVTATITVSSDADTYTLGASTVAGYTLGSLSKTNNTTYTATFTVSDGGTDYAAASAVPVSIVLTDSSANSNTAFTTAISQAGDAIYANTPDVTLSSDLTTIAEDGGVATITATLTNSLNNQWPEDIGFTLGFTGTATNTTDYTRSRSSITISAGNSSNTVTITGVADDLFDAASNETVIVSFDCIQTGAATLLSGQTQTITITDAESAPTVTLSVNNSSIDEDGGTTTATVTLSNATYQDVTVGLVYSGTATAAASGADYNNNASTSITISQGNTSADAATVITSVDDSDSEGDETIIIDVDSVSGGSAFEDTAQQVTVTISDDDNTAPVFSNLGGTANFTEDGSAVTLDSDATVADSENDALNSSNGNYTGSTLTIARNGGANTDDSFSVASGSQVAVSGTNLTNSIGDKFASYASSNGTMTVTFSGDLTTPTTALVNEVIQNIAYSNSSEDPITSVQLDWSFSDSQLSSTGVSNTTTVTITPVNDAPTLDNTQSPVLTAVTEDVADGDNVGTSVSAIVVNGSIDNIEAAQTTESIVVTQVDNSNGVWQYSTDNGANWNNFSSTTGASVDLTSTTSARLLSSSSANNKVRFVPDEHFNGNVSFTFRAWDEASGSNGGTADVSTTGGDSAFSSDTDSAILSITAVNDAPTIGTNLGLTVNEGGTGVITTTQLADSDPDDTGTGLTFTVTSAVSNGTLFLDADDDNTADSGEALTVNSTFTQQDLADGNIQYAHNGGETTSDSFVFSLADGGEDGATTLTNQTFSISVTSVNETPVITSSEVTSATEDTAYSYTISATDVDAGDSLTFAAPTLPTWLTFNASTGVLTGTPTNANVGSHSVVLTVTDTGNLSATQSFTITVINTNDAPVISSTAVTSATEDSAYSYTLIASDVDAGDSLTMAATTIPGWLSFNSATGVLSGTPTNDEVGSHAVVLSVSDTSSATDTQSFTIAVANVNDAPVITSASSISIDEDESTQVTVTATDVDSSALTWSITSEPALGVASITGSGTSATLSYNPNLNASGTDSLEITVSDGALSATQTITVIIASVNDRPAITGSPATSVNEGSRYSFTPVAVDNDGDDLTFSATNLPDWLALNSATGNIAGTPDAEDVGTHSNIVLSVSDGIATASLQAFSITVVNVNEAPVISGTPSALVEVDTPYSFVPQASDADGDTLSFSVENLPAWLTLDTATGALTGTPTSGDIAEYSGIVLTVSDGELSASLAAFSIEVIDPNVNVAPVVEAVIATTDEDVATEITLLGSDFNDDTLSYSVVTAPVNGTVEIINNIAIYTPVSNFNGEDSFTYQASDSLLTSEAAIVTITVNAVNDAPTITGEPATQVAFDSEYSFTPEATDIDNDSLTFSVTNLPDWADFDETTGLLSGVPAEQDLGTFADISISVSDGELEASLETFTIEVVDPDANTAPVATDSEIETNEDTPVTFTLEASDEDGDTLTYTITQQPVSGEIVVEGNSVTYTPNANVGDIQDTLRFSVTDGVDTSDEATVTIDIIAVNDAPEISGSPAMSVRVGMAYEFTPEASDVEEDTLTFTIENQPRWSSFDGNTGTLTGTPGTTDVGIYGNITISVSDGTDTAVLTGFNIEVLANSQPVISGVAVNAVEPGQSYSFTPVASDSDGDSLIFSIENQPEWATFDAETGTLSGIPGSDDIGIYTGIVISVSDGIDTVSLAAFDLEVCAVCGNVAPTISGLPATTVTEGVSYQFTPSASDVNGDTLTFSIVNQPAWTDFDSSTGTLSGTPGIADVGTTTGIVISVSDGEFSASLNAFSITVLEVNDAPVISGTPATSVFQNDEYRFTPTATDAEGDTLVFSIANRPAWAAFNTRTGTLRGTPVAANVGSYANVVIIVSDGQNSSSLESFTITVVARNNVPTISGSPRTAITQGNDYSFTPTATDIDGDSLTFSATGLPNWLSVNSATGALTGTPDLEDVGTTGSIILTVSDGTDSASLNAFTVTVTEANAVPVASNSSVTLDEDASVAITPAVSDGDGDALSFVVITDVQNGELNETASGWTYTPAANFNGSDSFVYQASDGESNSEQATISITVNSVNDRPVAVADSIVLEQNDAGIYLLDVLANDTDVDIATAGDALTLQGVQADFGNVSIVNNQIQFEPGLSFIGDVDLQYAIRDNARRSAQARVNLTINGVAGIGQPVLTVPDDLTVDADGLFTEVDLGVAEAVDADGNPLPVTLVRASNSFKPGTRKVFWRTEDSFGSVTTDSQVLNVNPLISLGKDKVVNEDSAVRMRVLLNGDAPVYPLTVNYTVGGTATVGEDHNAQSGSVTFSSGREQIITFNVFADDEVETNETITFTLNSDQNVGANNVSVVTISEANIAPEIRLMVSQSGDNRLTVAQDEGNVTISATVTDANRQDTVDTDWSSTGLSNLSDSPNQFLFDPAGVATGIYQVTLFASDDGDPILSNTADVYIEVVDTLAVLSDDLDTDGDLIPDSQEGYADSDGDGIPDYLDAIDDCNVVPEQASTQDGFLAESEPGVCLRQGSISALNSSNGVEVIVDETFVGRTGFNSRGESVKLQSAGLPEDPEATNIGGIFDFILYDLPEEGQIASIVLPQTRPVPSNALYRKYSVRSEQWTGFVIDDNNQIFSARGSKGVCPPPGSTRWVVGLTEGHWCVQLRVLDGGVNDDDGLVNGAIADPGGVAVVLAGNSLPDIQNDEAMMQWNTSIEIDVLANDTDVDGDTLTIESVDGSFGTAEITSGDTILYTPDSGFVGTEVLVYGVSDGNGGTGSGEVTITINGNRAPGARSDSATTTDDTPIEIDVLANDTDVDGDTLTIQSATVDVGDVAITANNTLLYTPADGFDGLATITYVVADSFGETDTATVSVVVDGNQSPQAMDDSVTTEYQTAVTISVLDNDMDVDGDTLTVVSAQASSGSVVINADQSLTFTPASGFSGTVAITYVISDGELTDEGTVSVTVAAKPVENVNVTKKSGGAVNLAWLLLLMLIGCYRLASSHRLRKP
ncbi:Ig-like domain-containing protein [Planctobacterium marinum]|uniref:Ig-like domain-containing protein n=1 Tax=Planctobacterium marinum TaxID=1631968 RepID=UPI001E655F50|nr:Ig-like domain-containing protein [Planctobacterium marinum]MCC2606356.1 tandem-95 repeat protein [Planctobacterium marinum]